MGLPSEIADLIERFDRNLETYKGGQYNEAQLRQDFLNPFLGALGWDMTNKAGYAEAYRDVIHEDAIKIGGATKAPDYCFRIGSVKKFFVEAKKPSVNLKDDVSPAFQLRRYAWSAKLPLSILTDFEEFAVYDCRIKPVQTDKASTGRVLYFTYKDYPAKWDELVNIFSREAVLKGSFDKYAESSKLKKGTATVDDAFLTEIEDWRDMLAKNIALRNTDFTTRELNFAVQRTIDRIVFLRICEDRGIEEYGRLQTQLNGTNVYKRLVQLFSQADDRYNSGLFHFQREKERHEEPDKLTPNISIDDKPLKDIINRLYYPESPYEFSVLSADILGQVYEQFLGKVIRLTAGHQAKVEEKPEVRKAGGVYYTPKYIVDYIVKNTVGQLLNPPLEKGGKGGFESSDVNPPQSPFAKGGNSITPKEAAKLRILDPACGSGSFLLGAYQYLLDWHRDWYVSDDPKKWCAAKNPPLYQAQGGDYHLTTSEKKRILLNNIYGVDIDFQSVEVTKLSLLLKVLEGENNQTLANQLKMFHERALPDLGDNIKCGNSLIGPDFYQQQTMLDDEDRYRVNVFDWEKEFPLIFPASSRAGEGQSNKPPRPQGEGRGEGGFDAVIGNPPWGAEYNQDEKEYLRTKYENIHVRTPESFNYFVGQMWICTQQRGLVGLIMPSSFLNQHEFWKTRKLLVESSAIYRIANLGDGVFQKVTAPSCVIVFGGDKTKKKSIYLDLRSEERTNLPTSLVEEQCGQDASQIGRDSDAFILQVRGGMKIIQKCYHWPTLRDIAEDVATGISSGLDSAFVHKQEDIKRLKLEKDLLRKLIIGREINRYSLTPTSSKQIIYTTRDIKIQDYPNCYAVLAKYRDRLSKRVETASGIIPWFTLYRPRRKKLFDEPKILIRQTADRILASVDYEKWYCLKSAIIVQLKENSAIKYEYLLAVLNSRLINFLYDDLVGEQARVFPEVKPVQLFKLPIRTINFTDRTDKVRHDKMVSLVDQMLSLNKQLSAAKTNHEKTALQRQINATDQQIDQLVYELYGLTEEEIKIVEVRK